MILRCSTVAAVFCLVGIAGGPAVATTLTQTLNRDAWLAQIGVADPGFTTIDESFDTTTDDGSVHQSITGAQSGITIAATLGVVDGNDDLGLRSTGAPVLSDDGTHLIYGSPSLSVGLRISNYPVTGPGDPFFATAQEFTIYLPAATKAFSFDFASVGWYNPLGITGLRAVVLGQSFFLRTATDTCCDGFFGLVSDTEFSSLTFTFAGQGNYDGFEIGRMTYASLPAVITPVPVPASAGLLGFAIAGLAFLRRRNRR